MVAVTVELVEVRCHKRDCQRLLCRTSPGAIVQIVCRCGATTVWPTLRIAKGQVTVKA